MLFDTSINDKETKRQINELVGKPFGLLEIVKRSSIGTARMKVNAYSPLFRSVMQWDKHSIHANIAMRPNGIIVILPIRLNNYSWIIPYHYLSIFKTEELVIHGQGEYLKLAIQPNQKMKVIDKILAEKIKHGTNQSYYGNEYESI